MISQIVANSIAPYIEKMYYTNKSLIKLYGFGFYNSTYGSNLLLEIIHDVPRLIPYSYDDKVQRLKINKSYGLLKFQNEILYLFDDYSKMLTNSYLLLDYIRLIRNKYEHQLHNVEYLSDFGSKNSFCYCFKVGNKRIKITSDEITTLFKELNVLFSKLVSEIQSYAKANNKVEYPFYEKISRFNFLDFNIIYDSDLLHKIGIIQFDF